eukprot:Gb_24200 [translate_table: standard]
MEGTVIDGAMLSSPSMDPLHLHHLSRQHPLPAIGPISVVQHVVTGQDVNGQSLALESQGTPRTSMNCSKGKPALSDEDEPSFTEEGNDNYKSKKVSPWQRMKWTDSMVRLLITVVLYVGEDVDCTNNNNDGNKRKSAILQKKGKWKSVSRIMMDKGCFVSPQQCEDKFNDLNKRYKRLNDVLGRGTACRVVETPSLLDSMDHLSAKVKDDVRKILSSKHLFYKEMCSYHNGSRLHVESDHGLQPCMTQSPIPSKTRDVQELFIMSKQETGGGGGGGGDEDEEEDEDDDDDDEEEDEDDDYETVGAPEVEEGMGEFMKKRKIFKNLEGVHLWASPSSYECGKPSAQYNLNQEIMGVLHDGTKTEWQKRQWMINRTMQLEEQKMGLQAQAFELAKQRLKWQRLSSKKNRELESLKLGNEKMKLDNERMALQLKQKELEMEFKRSDVSMTSLALKLDKIPEREQHDIGRGQCAQ